MTVYCPECGKPNTDQATACASCEAEIKAKAPSGQRRFKGTMIMGNAGKAGPSTPAPTNEPVDPPEPAASPEPAPPSEPARPKMPARGKFKQTMMMGSPGIQEELDKLRSQQDTMRDPPRPPDNADAPATDDSVAWSASASDPVSSQPAPPDEHAVPEDQWPSSPDLVLPTRRSSGLWWGLGCLTLTVLACMLFSWWGANEGIERLMESGGQAGIEVSRVAVVQSLVDARDHCRAGKPGPGTPSGVHPSASPRARALMCTFDETIMQKLSRRGESDATAYTPLADDDPITSLEGINPERCYEYDVDTFHILACAGQDTSKLKIIDVTMQ